MNLRFLVCAFAASVIVSLQAVRVVSKSGGPYRLSDFTYISEDGARVDVDIQEVVLNDGDEREFDGVSSFCFRVDDEYSHKQMIPKFNDSELDNSKIVTFISKYKITSK